MYFLSTVSVFGSRGKGRLSTVSIHVLRSCLMSYCKASAMLYTHAVDGQYIVPDMIVKIVNVTWLASLDDFGDDEVIADEEIDWVDEEVIELKFGERCFSHAGPKAWNALPAELEDLTDHSAFKRQLKTFLFERAFTTWVSCRWSLNVSALDRMDWIGLDWTNSGITYSTRSYMTEWSDVSCVCRLWYFVYAVVNCFCLCLF